MVKIVRLEYNHKIKELTLKSQYTFEDRIRRKVSE